MALPLLRSIARSYLKSVVFWFGFALLMGVQYRQLERSHLLSSFIGLLGDVTVRTTLLTLWTPPIFYLVGKYLDSSSNRLKYSLGWGAGAVLFVVLYTSAAWVLVPPYDDVLHKAVSRSLRSWMDNIRAGFADEIFIYFAIVVAAHAYHYLGRLRKQEREKYEYEQALAASELQALKMQLQPHFLFNTLHGIATLAGSDGAKAKAMIIKLSNLLRIALDRSTSDLIPLQRELKFVREYLDLESMRFGDRLMVKWLIAPDTGRLLVPQMILQPLVENAIRYGVASSREGGWIEIHSSTSNRILTIRILNNLGSKASNGSGVGLRNVEARLRYLYAGDASLQLSFAEQGTAALTLMLPALNPQAGFGERSQLQITSVGAKS